MHLLELDLAFSKTVNAHSSTEADESFRGTSILLWENLRRRGRNGSRRKPLLLALFAALLAPRFNKLDPMG